MLSKFRSYQLAVKLYKDCKLVILPGDLKNQMMRAASSVALNLSEGNGRRTKKDREKYFTYAMASTRELQAMLDLEPESLEHLRDKLDHLAASIYKLRR